MIDTEIVKDESGKVDLCRTFSTENYKLLQVETNQIYGSSVLDLINGYYLNNKPYSRYLYKETNEKDDNFILKEEEAE